MSAELRPCPFCGGPARVERVAEPYGEVSFNASCDNPECGVLAIATSPIRAEAIEMWNRRADGAEELLGCAEGVNG